MVSLIKNIAYGVVLFIVLALFVSWCGLRDFQESPEFQAAVEQNRARQSAADSLYMASLNHFIQTLVNDPGNGLNAIRVDGSIMAVDLASYSSRAECREVAQTIAQGFSKLRLSRGTGSGVTVKVLHNGLIMAEADARNTQVTAVR